MYINCHLTYSWQQYDLGIFDFREVILNKTAERVY